MSSRLLPCKSLRVISNLDSIYTLLFCDHFSLRNKINIQIIFVSLTEYNIDSGLSKDFLVYNEQQILNLSASYMDQLCGPIWEKSQPDLFCINS